MILEPVVEAMRPLCVTHLWLADAQGAVLESWRADGQPDLASTIRAHSPRWIAEASNGSLEIVADETDHAFFWVRNRSDAGAEGLLAGRTPASNEPDSSLATTLRELEPWLRATCSLGLKALACERDEKHPADSASRPLFVRPPTPPAPPSIPGSPDEPWTDQKYLQHLEDEVQKQTLERLEKEVDRRTAKLREQTAELRSANQRMKRDLNAAARVQKALLPTELPRLERAAFAWHFRTCDELGGDSLNIFRLDEHRVGLFVLDVSGHGVQAALLSVTLCRLLSPMLDQSSLLKRRLPVAPGYEVVSPAEVADGLNRRFQLEAGMSQYFTFQYGILDVRDRVFRYVSAGHPGPAHLPDNGPPVVLNTPGFPIGCVPNARYEVHSVPLAPRDRLYLFSDGLTESMDTSNVLFGDRELLSTLDESRNASLPDSVTNIAQASLDWSKHETPSDDVSVLAAVVT